MLCLLLRNVSSRLTFLGTIGTGSGTSLRPLLVLLACEPLFMLACSVKFFFYYIKMGKKKSNSVRVCTCVCLCGCAAVVMLLACEPFLMLGFLVFKVRNK